MKGEPGAGMDIGTMIVVLLIVMLLIACNLAGFTIG